MACAQQQQQMQAEQPAAAPVANEKDFQRMTVQQVRVILRQKNLNVGGSKEMLIARYFDAVNAGEVTAHTVRIAFHLDRSASLVALLLLRSRKHTQSAFPFLPRGCRGETSS
jgi:hypothetical protein